MNTSSNPWHFFDRIYCISLLSRKDRLEEVKKQFASVGLLELVEFILVEKQQQNPEEGIFTSHMHCLQKGLAAGAETILVFEDDVCFQGFSVERLRQAVTFLRDTPSWKAFFLGGITGAVKKTKSPAVSKIHYRCLAHAYALNRPFAKQFSQNTWQEIPFDNLLQNHCSEFFSLTPMIAFQSNASTDNKTFFIDRSRRFFGGLQLIQKLNEFYQQHKSILISSHLFFFFLLLILAWKYLQKR